MLSKRKRMGFCEDIVKEGDVILGRIRRQFYSSSEALILAILFAVEEYHGEGGNAIEANGAFTASSAVSEFAVGRVFFLF